MGKRVVGVYMSDDMLKRIDERSDNRSRTVEQDLDRYYFMLDYELEKLSKNFSIEEYCLITDALNGVLFSPWSIRLLPAQIEDAIIYEKASRKWKVKGQELVEKLKKCNYGQLLAIADAAERFWNSDPKEHTNIQDMIRKYFRIPLERIG